METPSREQPTIPEQNAPVQPALDGSGPPAPAPDAQSREETEEVDLWWGSYDGRALIPEYVLWAVLMAAIVAVFWIQGIWKADAGVRHTLKLLIAAFWIFQALRWLYPVVAFNYRMTTHRLFRERGFFPLVSQQIELAHIAQIVVERGPLERLVKVGRVRVVADRKDIPPLVLTGIRDPEHVALKIRRWAQEARKQVQA